MFPTIKCEDSTTLVVIQSSAGFEAGAFEVFEVRKVEPHLNTQHVVQEMRVVVSVVEEGGEASVLFVG